MPKLLLKFEAAVIKEIPFDKPSLTVGRKSDNDIVIDNQAVSGHHCKIFSSGDTYFVEDLNSTNGTLVNGKKIIKAGLHNNDTIGIVKHSLVFIQAPVPAAKPAVTERTAGSKKDMKHETDPGLIGAVPPAGTLQVIEGVVDKLEYELNDLSTYIGKSDRAAIPVKGSGIFGKAPELAAMIAKRPEGYFLVSVEDGAAKLNGVALAGREALKNGDIIEVGGSKFTFSLKKT